MPVRLFGLIRHLLAELRESKTKYSRADHPRRERLLLEVLEERALPSAGAQEQYMLTLVNRFRANPSAELSLILGANDPDVSSDLTFFNVDRNALAAQWATLTSAPPLAWNDFLGASSLAHSQAMLAAQDQNHQVAGELDPWTRMVNAGYTNYTFLAENIYAFAHSIFEAEAAFAIDWGNNPPTGIQSPAGHRANLLDSDLREIGIGLVTAPIGSVMGPLLLTQDFGNRSTIGNPFLLGSIFSDTNNDSYFNAGEGLAGVNVAITGPSGNFQTTTTAAGGYQIQVPAGTYQVVASGGGLAAPLSRSVVVGSVNVQADFIKPPGLPPAAPAFNGPPATTTSTTPTFSWTATAGATQYDLWVNNVTTGQSQVIRNQTLTVNSFTPQTPLPAASYQAWVRVTTATGTSGWSATYSFTIAPPAIPTLTAPTGSTSNVTPSLTWTASTDAATYDLWVTNQTTGQSQIIRQQSLTSNSFTPTSPLPLGTYQAWVQAFNSAGNTAGWSAGLAFTITGPTLTAPTGTTTINSPTFTWTASASATRYDLWVSNLTTGQDQIVRQQNLTTTSFTPANALALGSYSAWIQAYNGVTALGWSPGLSFTIVAPAAPTLSGPAATITSTTPTFAWSASTGATQYDVWADNRTTGQSQVVRQTVGTTSFTPANPIPRGQYTFWVRAGNSANAFGAWSAGYSFLIDTSAPQIPVLTGPIGSTSNLTPTITWSTSTGATRYDLWVDGVGQSQVIRQQNLTTSSFTPSTPLAVGSYTAWIEAFDSTNQTRGWSGSMSFTITLPSAPLQLVPTGTLSSTTPPTFSWAVVANAVRYDLWVDNASTGQTQIIRQQNLSTNSYAPLAALAKGSYRFWVRAFNASGNAGSWSAEADFTLTS